MYIIPLFYLYGAIFRYATCRNQVITQKWCLCPIFCEIALQHFPLNVHITCSSNYFDRCATIWGVDRYVSHDRSGEFKTMWLSDMRFLQDCCDKASANFDRRGNFDTFFLLHRFLKIDFSKYNLTNFLSLN